MPQPPMLFDRAVIARRYARRAPGADFVTELVRADLGDRLATVRRRFSRALALGPDATTLPRRARSAEAGIVFERAATLVPAPDAPLVDPDALVLPRDDYELIVSLMDLQIVNDVPGFLARLRAHLAPDGLAMLAFAGGATLQELRAAWLVADARTAGGAYARIAPFIDTRDAGALLQRAGFALPVADTETHVVRYPDPLALMRELKALGASNPLADRPGRPVTPTHLMAAAAAYAEAAADPDGRVRATLEIVWMSGWAPHESQQQPLAPGSAEISLAKVLGRES